jgi:hypothetical protein
MRWWVLAILPTVIGILPLKEIRENNRRWYGFLRWAERLYIGASAAHEDALKAAKHGRPDFSTEI